MSVTAHGNRPMDAELVAYLDGALEPAAQAELERLLESDAGARDRLAVLAGGGRGLRQAFDGLLDAAPRARLEAMLSEAVEQAPPMPGEASAGGVLRLLLGAAAALLLVVAGAAGGYWAAGWPRQVEVAGLAGPEDADESDAWREAVARQVSLYSPESVAAMPVDRSARASELARLGSILGLPLSPAAVQLPGLALKRTELLQFEDRPLAQLLYYAADTGPIALCIMSEQEVEPKRSVERRAGLTLLYWTSGGRAFLLLGAAPLAELQSLADSVATRMTL